jgi:phosphoglycerate kinase
MGGAKADDSLEISRYVLGNNIANYVLTGGVVAQVFLAAKGVDLGEPNMALLEKKELMGLIPGIKELVEQYPKQIVVQSMLLLTLLVNVSKLKLTAATEYPILM